MPRRKLFKTPGDDLHQVGDPVENRPGYLWGRGGQGEAPLIPRKATPAELAADRKKKRMIFTEEKIAEKQAERAEISADQQAFAQAQTEIARLNQQIIQERAGLDAIRARQDRTRLSQLQASRRLLTGGASLLSGTYRGFS